MIVNAYLLSSSFGFWRITADFYPSLKRLPRRQERYQSDIIKPKRHEASFFPKSVYTDKRSLD
ncbi:MAG: hypothetical protein HY973_01740 [Candidatus Kerfeldbacteria bacterium]|nr:hypothetical protein [Candidatus Kerfeldbacteria bacterium]